MHAAQLTWNCTLIGCDARNGLPPRTGVNCGPIEGPSSQISIFVSPWRPRSLRYEQTNRGLGRLCARFAICRLTVSRGRRRTFDIHRLSGASGESQPTLNMYSDERTFRCPDGAYRLFEWHLKRGDTRVHFIDSLIENEFSSGI